MFPISAEALGGLLNAPDLILLAILLVSAGTGAAQGLVRTVFQCFGRLLALAGAVFGARALAPMMARFLVTPIVGDVFERQAATLFAAAPETANALQTEVTEFAVSMAEGLSYFISLLVLMLSLTLLVGLLSKTLSFLSSIGPLSFINRLGGLLLGLLFGVLVCFLLLWAVQVFAPTTLSDLGWLSPAHVQETVLTKALLHYVPGYGNAQVFDLFLVLTA